MNNIDVIDKNSICDDPEKIEAGVSHESMLITTDSFEEFSQEISTASSEAMNLNDSKDKFSNINEIQEECIKDKQIPAAISTDNNGIVSKSSSFVSTTSSLNLLESINDTGEDNSGGDGATIISDSQSLSNMLSKTVVSSTSSTTISNNHLSDNQSSISGGTVAITDDYLHDSEWLNKTEHVFILSTAGKPIYSLHGNEDKLASLYGVMQAIVSVVQSQQDTIMSIHAAGVKFVFLVKCPLILVAASRKHLSVQQIQLQLTDVYHQILSTLTLSHMTKIFEKRKNFDLRRLLAGSERLIDNLLMSDNKKSNRKISNNPFIFMTHSVRILPLSLSVREHIISAIQSNCSKIKNLVFAVLLANNKLIALVRMKKYFIHPADLRIIFNLIECSESFKTAESWTPICLPKFDSNGFLHAHVSYLADDCQACLILLSVQRDMFFTLSEAKKKITEKLRRSNYLKSINDAMDKGINLRTIGIPEIRHFLYKSKSNAQLLCSEVQIPYNTPGEFERLEAMYYNIHQRIHFANRPLKLIYEMHEKEILLAWVTSGYELYAIFEPTIDKNTVIDLVNKLLGWIKKEEDTLFILNAPTF